ncbi:MAG TPA: hypothetical protein VNZ57_12750 [Longimicrobiales bacterium]|nr:hypothetical protein [Longimicrobiales bacterium]
MATGSGRSAGGMPEGGSDGAAACAGAVNSWLKEGTLPRGANVLQLCEQLGLSAHWLLVGEGPKYASELRETSRNADARAMKQIARIVRAWQRDRQESATSLGEAAEASMGEHRRLLEADNDASEPTGTDGGGP